MLPPCCGFAPLLFSPDDASFSPRFQPSVGGILRREKTMSGCAGWGRRLREMLGMLGAAARLNGHLALSH